MNPIPDDVVPSQLGGLNPLFRDAAMNLAVSLGIDLEKDSKRMSQWFRSGVCGKYRESILECLRRHKVSDLTEIALRAQVHPSVRSRYKSGETAPEFDTLFFVGTAAKVDWNGALPHFMFTITSGMIEAISETHAQILNREPLRCDLTVLALMRFILFDKTWLRAELSQDPSMLFRATSDAQSYVSQRLGRPFTASRDELHKMIAEWRQSYLLFHLLIPFDWPM